MTKVAIVCPREPWYHGGLEKVAANTAKHLKNHFDIEIYCTGEKNYEEIWNNVPVHVFKGYTKGYRYSPILRREIKRSEFDIIHAHGFTVHSSYVASAEKNSASFVINPHFHEIGSKPYYRLLRSLYDPTIGRKILKEADRIICDSNVEKNRLVRKFKINNKIVVNPVGVDVDKIKNATPYEFEGRLILYVGRLEKYKNIHQAIQTFTHLPEEYRFFIIGNGPYKDELERFIVNRNLNGRIKILSGLSNEEVHRWMRTAGVFITLSDIEAFGITVIESLAAGTPVIVNNKMALAELAAIHSDCVFKVNLDETSPKELAKLIIEKSISRVKADLNEYRWENICRKHKCVYEGLLSKSKI